MLATTAPVVLRAVAPDDDALVTRLFTASRPDLDLLPADVRDGLVAMQVRAQLGQWAAQHPAARHVVITVNGVDVGRVVVAESNVEVRVVDIVVLAEHRRRGIASAVLGAVLAGADAAGRPVRLSVWPTNIAAIELYDRLGFEIVPGEGMHVQMSREPNRGDDRP